MKLEVTSVRVAESSILDAIASPARQGLDARNGTELANEAPSDAAPQQNLLPVDPGFTIQMHSSFRDVKGQDMEFSHRADASLLGRPMPESQSGADPAKWLLNFDVFVFCDGHSVQRDRGSWVRAAVFDQTQHVVLVAEKHRNMCYVHAACSNPF